MKPKDILVVGINEVNLLDYVHDFLDRNFAVERCFALLAEFDGAGFEGEEGMVLAYGYIRARHDGRAALAHDYRAWLGPLAVR
mgnify:CR=1 FL=1